MGVVWDSQAQRQKVYICDGRVAWDALRFQEYSMTKTSTVLNIFKATKYKHMMRLATSQSLLYRPSLFHVFLVCSLQNIISKQSKQILSPKSERHTSRANWRPNPVPNPWLRWQAVRKRCTSIGAVRFWNHRRIAKLSLSKCYCDDQKNCRFQAWAMQMHVLLALLQATSSFCKSHTAGNYKSIQKSCSANGSID